MDSTAQRVTTVNKTKSPIIEKTIQARAKKITIEDIEETKCDGRNDEVVKTEKVVKAVGIGRNRSIMSTEEVAVEETRDEANNNSNEKNEGEVPNTSFCGISWCG
mmetsp:Transcript_10675/g.13507  ORF Transcript_10675/g.13507 Transcript_10675/m.13507 type:complete len:105 (-) Transcript_10675:204-518(-)